MPLPYNIIRNLKTRLFFSSLNVRSENQSFNNSVVLGSLAICAQHTASIWYTPGPSTCYTCSHIRTCVHAHSSTRTHRATVFINFFLSGIHGTGNTEELQYAKAVNHV